MVKLNVKHTYDNTEEALEHLVLLLSQRYPSDEDVSMKILVRTKPQEKWQE